MAHTTIRPVCPVSCVSCVSVWLILSSPPTTWDPFYLLSILQFGDFRSVCQFSILLSILAFNFNLFFFLYLLATFQLNPSPPLEWCFITYLAPLFLHPPRSQTCRAPLIVNQSGRFPRPIAILTPKGLSPPSSLGWWISFQSAKLKPNLVSLRHTRFPERNSNAPHALGLPP